MAVSELDADVVALYVHDVKQKYEQIFVPFKKMCRREKVISSCFLKNLALNSW